MALNKFGIKEVADVRFYEVGKIKVDPETGNVQNAEGGNTLPEPTLELDTLKVSTIEFTAEQSEARGGKGNAPLIIWDYGREVNVTLEDALLSMKAMQLMFGDDGIGSIEINANKFPGTYAVVGKTFARNYDDGKDHLFTFYIPKAKIQSENTLTMEAEGDPTVFNMSLRVLRGDNGKMMELIANDDPHNASSIWGTETTTVEYVATLNYIGGKRETWYGGDDNTITLPELEEGYKWVKAGTTEALTGDQVLTENTVFEEVSNS
jgi:hypothetical protein